MKGLESQIVRGKELERLADRNATEAKMVQEKLRSERIKAMTRKEMLLFAQRTAASLKQHEQWAIAHGVIEEGSYTWQDELFENSGVDIKMMGDLVQLSDNDLKKIADAYY